MYPYDPARVALVLVIALGSLLGASCKRAPAPPHDATTMLRRATGYLWAKQGEDGGWHSEVHGLARSGQSWTPFILYHLLLVPDSLHALPDQETRRALAFIEARLDSSGALGLSDPLIRDYPVYATSYAVLAYTEAQRRGLLGRRQQAQLARMTRYLLSQQMTARQGVASSYAAYGGWGLGGPPGEATVPAAAAHADLSHTRRALEALRAVGALDAFGGPVVLTAAGRFLDRTQKQGEATYDGGFHYAPALPALNKAGLHAPGDTTPEAPRSYATATCDGLLALLAAGYAPDGKEVQGAIAYLAAQDTLARATGLPPARSAWSEIMFFYHLAGRAEVYHRLGWRRRAGASWQEEIVALLSARQRPDGSFLNPQGAPNKEDDPLIATTLALIALTRAL